MLTHVLNGLSAAGTVDLSGTSAIGSLSRLRAQCRAAKERLSTTAVTSLVAELPGHRSEVRLTRNELDDAIRQPLADFAGVVQETLERNGVRSGELVAVASVGGGARIPIITTTLSEHFRVPVITTGQPELTAAIGGGLRAARGTVDEGATSMAERPPPTAAAAAVAATADGAEVDPEDDAVEHLPGAGVVGRRRRSRCRAHRSVRLRRRGRHRRDGRSRPQMQFAEPETDQYEAASAPAEAAMLVAGVVLVLAALAAAVLFVMRNDESTPSPASTTVTATTTPPAPTSAAPPPATQSAAPPPPVTQTITRAPGPSRSAAAPATAATAADQRGAPATAATTRRRRRAERRRRSHQPRSSRPCRTRPSPVCRSFRHPIQPPGAPRPRLAS